MLPGEALGDGRTETAPVGEVGEVGGDGDGELGGGEEQAAVEGKALVVAADEQVAGGNHPEMLCPGDGGGAGDAVAHGEIGVGVDIEVKAEAAGAETEVEILVIEPEGFIEAPEGEPGGSGEEQGAAAEEVHFGAGWAGAGEADEGDVDTAFAAGVPDFVRTVEPVDDGTEQGFGQRGNPAFPGRDEAGAEGGVVIQKKQVRGAAAEGFAGSVIAVSGEAAVGVALPCKERELGQPGGRRFRGAVIGDDNFEIRGTLAGQHAEAGESVGMVAENRDDEAQLHLRESTGESGGGCPNG